MKPKKLLPPDAHVGKTKLLTKLTVYSAAYGLLSINYIDLVTPGSSVPGYHVWMTIQCFAPFIPMLFVLGFDGWKLAAALGVWSSLYNDLFYAPVGGLLFGRTFDLLEWYSFQFGFKGLQASWTFNGGFFTFPVTSLLMGLSIYVRIVLIYVLLWKWWLGPTQRKKEVRME
jgi:hypothetical protein